MTKVLPSRAEVPGKELEALKERAVRSGFDFIDFWAVDFDWQPNQPGDVPVTYANIDRARAALGYQPTTSVEQGVALQWAWRQRR